MSALATFCSLCVGRRDPERGQFELFSEVALLGWIGDGGIRGPSGLSGLGSRDW